MRQMWVRVAAVAVAALVGIVGDVGEAHAARSIGVGVGRGTRVLGLSVRAPGQTSVQLNAGWWDRGGWGVSLDGLADLVLIKGSVAALSVELGAGAGLGFGEHVEAAGALVGGLRLELMPIPLDFSVEYRPLIDILPDVDLELGYVGGHVRLYF